MPSRQANQIATAFRNKAIRLDNTRARVEEAFARGHLRVSDVEVTYAGLFLQLVVGYETAVEEFVLGLMVRPGGVASAAANVRGRLQVRNYAHARQVAAGPGGHYASWIGKTDVLSVADLVLLNGEPFRSADWQFVEQCKYVRNAIAHPSDHAFQKFQRHVVQMRPLPTRERTVHGYLRGRLSSSSSQTRWENLAAGLSAFVTSTVV